MCFLRELAEYRKRDKAYQNLEDALREKVDSYNEWIEDSSNPVELRDVFEERLDETEIFLANLKGIRKAYPIK